MWFGKSESSDPSLDINHQLSLFMDMPGTRPSTHCSGAAFRCKKCLTCTPLFPKLKEGPGNTRGLHPALEPSLTLITSMVVAAMVTPVLA